MKKTIKLLVIIDFCLFISFTLGGIILEILRSIPFSKGVAFDVAWNIFYWSIHNIDSSFNNYFFAYY